MQISQTRMQITENFRAARGSLLRMSGLFLSRHRRNFRWWQGWDVGIFCCLLTVFVGLLQLFVPKNLGTPAVESAKNEAT